MNENLNPKDAELAKLLEASADDINPNPVFVAQLEDKLKAAHKPKARWTLPDMRTMFTVVGWAGALAVLALVMNWAIRTLAPNPPQPASGISTPTPQSETINIAPTGEPYDWNGTKLYVNAKLPDTPGEASIYVAQPDSHITLESVRTIAAQFGMKGQVYYEYIPLPGPSIEYFLVVDGNQRLQVQTAQYYTYYPDYTRAINAYDPADYPDAETIIKDFLTAKGFDFPYHIERNGFYGAYSVQPLTPDGLTVWHEYFSTVSLNFRFDKEGLYAVDATLLNYAPVDDKKYRVISAEEALKKLLDPTLQAGFVGGQASGYQPLTGWTRPRRENETVTVWGYMNSYTSADGGMPLVTLDGYTAIGNVADVPPDMPNTFVEVTGQFQTVDGAKVFNVDSWKAYEGYEDGIFGTLERQGDNAVMVTPDQGNFILPDVPADVPLPMENAYATGVKQGDTFEWKTLDNRGGFGGGGGGGGGSGFYKINFTGTPVPPEAFLPTPQAFAIGGDTSQGYPYTVVAGDTCQSISNIFMVDVQTLIAVNGLAADCSNLMVGQVITIPYTTAMPNPSSSGGGGGGGGGGMGSVEAYLVQPGDTVESIAAANGITPEELMALNGMTDPSELQAGQTITLQTSGVTFPQTVESLRGILSITIYEKTDGSRRTVYNFITDNPNYPYLVLTGDGLDSLQSNNNRPVDIWGTIDLDRDTGAPTLKVDRFEIPFPDLKFQIMKGVEQSIELDDKTVLLFTDESGNEYVELAPNCFDVISQESVAGTGRVDEPILLEALPVPGLTFGGRAAICVYSTSLAINPKTNQPMELTVSADQPNVLPEPPSAEAGNLPTVTIEKVELVYFVPDQRFLTPDSNRGPAYIQPAWLFFGHYSDGSIAMYLIQALDPIYLLPETEPVTPPG